MAVKVITDRKRIEEIFSRGVVAEILPSREAFLEKLFFGERLKFYIGADPTSDSLHLSHAKNYMFLEELRQLGHEVVVLIGDFTAQIGDPSGKNSARKQLSEKEVKENVKKWMPQIAPFLDFNDKKNPPRLAYNSKWLAKMSLKDLLPLAANFTVQQMLERDMFEKREKDGAPIYLHEFLYPLMQGYDSVVLDVDAELCGTDQIFNALAGRTLLKRLKNKDKFVIAVNLMENPKTGELMSKSRGTGVFLSSPSGDMYGAIMAQPDEMTEVLFVNCTRIPLSEKESILRSGGKEAKARVAFEIVKKIYGEKSAQKAAENFEKLFSKKEIAEDLPDLALKNKEISATDLVVASGVAKSKGEARRLIEQGGLTVEKETIKDPARILRLSGEAVKIGKRHFFRIKKNR